MSTRELIVNADDFGCSLATNKGIALAHERGIVTTASLMVRWPGAQAAADYARTRPALGVGLHVDLSEWSYSDGEWVLVYDRGPAGDEIDAQLAMFRRLLGREPTHLDSHQHVHRTEPVASLLATHASRLGLPLRDTGSIRYCGDFYGQSGKGDPWRGGITPEALVAIIEALPDGVTELGCHPGLDAQLDSTYRDERLVEVQTLCDPRIRAAIEAAGVTLRTFAGPTHLASCRSR